MHAIIISIGDELLIGQTVNTNATWMGKELNSVGVEVVEVLTVSDQKGAIEKALAYGENSAEIVLLTGGLGPTKDDITKKVFADYFGAPLIENKEALENVEGFFAKYNRPMLPINKLQALVPKGSVMLLNKVGTAPGMWMNKGQKVFVSMPGVPSEMRYLMREEVIPRLKDSFELPEIVHQTMMTQGLGESYISEEISDIEDGLPTFLKLAYLPSPGTVKLRLTGRGKDRKVLVDAIKAEFTKIKSRIGSSVFSDEEKELEEVIADLLLGTQQTVSTAESCSGGGIAARITSVAGSSSYFQGGIVAYANEIKQDFLGVSKNDIENHGAVSEPVIVQMAKGIREKMKTTYGIATSGIAGPGGGSVEKPIGTVWIAVANDSEVVVRKFEMGEGRKRVTEKTILSALSLLIEVIKK